MQKNAMENEPRQGTAAPPPGGGDTGHLWAVRRPILQWISPADLPALDGWFSLATAQADEVPPPSPAARGAGLAADVAWLADYLAWIGAYRENADLQLVSDLQVGAAAEAAAGWLVAPVAALAERFGAVPPTWNEEEALRRGSRLALPARLWDGLEWIVSLAYVTGLYYEPPEVAPADHLPSLLASGRSEAQVLRAQAQALAETPGLSPDEQAPVLAAAEALSRIARVDAARLDSPRPQRATAPWRRRPAVPSRKS